MLFSSLSTRELSRDRSELSRLTDGAGGSMACCVGGRLCTEKLPLSFSLRRSPSLNIEELEL